MYGSAHARRVDPGPVSAGAGVLFSVTDACRQSQGPQSQFGAATPRTERQPGCNRTRILIHMLPAVLLAAPTTAQMMPWHKDNPRSDAKLGASPPRAHGRALLPAGAQRGIRPPRSPGHVGRALVMRGYKVADCSNAAVIAAHGCASQRRMATTTTPREGDQSAGLIALQNALSYFLQAFPNSRADRTDCAISQALCKFFRRRGAYP